LVDFQPEQVIGLFANCWALEYMVEDSLPVVCPSINPNGSSIDELTALMESNRNPGTYVVLEPVAYVPPTAPGTLIASIARPAPGPQLDIYDLTVTVFNPPQATRF
jgi:hypothetical protein